MPAASVGVKIPSRMPPTMMSGASIARIEPLAARPSSPQEKGSPPCQPYSSAGPCLGADDPRDGWPATLDAIRDVRPRWVVIENVVGSPADEWADALRLLYPEVMVWRSNAINWGLPSRRDRLYVVAGPRHWTPPAPTHCDPDAPWLIRASRHPWKSFSEVIGTPHNPLWHPNADAFVVWSEWSVRSGNQVFDQKVPCLAITTKKVHCGPFGTYALLRKPQFAALGLIQPPEERAAADERYRGLRRTLTVEECAALCGFPSGYPFQGPKEKRYRQVGNCVAPIMAEVIGRAILEAA